MSVVSYNGQKLIPAPFVNVVKNFTKTGDGKIIGTSYTINLIGTIVAFKGSPYDVGGFNFLFWGLPGYPPDNVVDAGARLQYILRKQDAIRRLFKSTDEGRLLEIQSSNGSAPLKFNAKLVSIDFPDDLFYDTCKYTITLEGDKFDPEEEDIAAFTEYLQEVHESWSIESDENLPQGLNPDSVISGDAVPRTYRVTHTIGATGKRFYAGEGGTLQTSPGNYGVEAYHWAKAYVDDKLGLDISIIDELDATEGDAPIIDAITSDTHIAYNHIRSINRDETGGSYEVTETWLLATDSAIEDFTVEKSTSIDQPYDRYTISGTITGLEERDANTLALDETKYNNALAKFNVVADILIDRAAFFGGISVGDLNPIPLSSVIGKNPIVGVINYTYEYDERPVIISCANSVVITVSDTLEGQSFASIFVLGRASGPVLQDLKTKPSMTRTLDIEIVIPPPTFVLTAAYFKNNPRLVNLCGEDPDTADTINSIIEAVKPTIDETYARFESPIQETWAPLEGRYTFNQQWTFELSS